MEEIKSWVLNIASAAVLMVILDLLIPESRIRKFTRLLTGFIIMFIIINPVVELIGNGGNGLLENLRDESFLLIVRRPELLMRINVIRQDKLLNCTVKYFFRIYITVLTRIKK